MKKLKYYPTMWQTYPFSMELFIHAEKEAKANEAKLQNESGSKFKPAFGW